MKKFTTLGAAIMMFIPGVLYLFSPQLMLNAPEIKLATANEFHVFRAAYGGGFLGMAALFGVGVWSSRAQYTSLLAIALILPGFILGRVYSILIDGWPTPLFVGVLFAELFFSVLAVIALRQIKADA